MHCDPCSYDNCRRCAGGVAAEQSHHGGLMHQISQRAQYSHKDAQGRHHFKGFLFLHFCFALSIQVFAFSPDHHGNDAVMHNAERVGRPHDHSRIGGHKVTMRYPLSLVLFSSHSLLSQYTQHTGLYGSKTSTGEVHSQLPASAIINCLSSYDPAVQARANEKRAEMNLPTGRSLAGTKVFCCLFPVFHC
jgi:hypothetical protein